MIEPKDVFNLNKINATISWISIFCLAWGLILNKIPSNPTTWGFFVFFLVVALIAGVYIREDNRERNNVSKPHIVKKD